VNREPTDPVEKPGAGIPGFQTGEGVRLWTRIGFRLDGNLPPGRSCFHLFSH
jgi:hypothetical protein